MPSPSRAIVLTFDRLSRRCLSFYGHEWIEAPNLERLAACSVVFDQHFASENGSLAWHSDFAAILNRLPESGVVVRNLVEDSPTNSPDESDGLDEDLESSPFARLITQGQETLADLAKTPEASWLLTLRSSGIAWPCVATEEFAGLYADEFEGEQAEFADEIKLAEIAYAACVTQLDHVVGRLIETLDRLFPENRPILIVSALAGESLGEIEPLPLEHVDSSPAEETWQLRDEMVHTLLLVNKTGTNSVGSRRQELIQASDILPTLLDWFGRSSSQPNEPNESVTEFDNGRSLLPLIENKQSVDRKALFLRDNEGHAAMRTREFLLIERDVAELLNSSDNADHRVERADVTGFSCQLFLKPEDVWEVNDVADQHPEQVEIMRAAIRDRYQ